MNENNIVMTLENGQSIIPISNSIFKSIIRTKSQYIAIDGNSIVIKKTFFSKKRVIPPVFRYRYMCNNNSYKLEELRPDEKRISESNYKDGLIGSLANQHTILVVLESPHKEEYNDNFQPIAPALGKTGQMISKKLGFILQYLADNKWYDFGGRDLDIVITNPVPYQTSLYELHHRSLKGEYEILRNEIWKVLWNNEEILRTSLRKLIKNTNSRLILNCCTSKLRDEVNSTIRKMDGYCETVNLLHPIAWTFQNNIGDLFIKDRKLEHYRLRAVGDYRLLINIKDNSTYELDEQSFFIIENYIVNNNSNILNDSISYAEISDVKKHLYGTLEGNL